MDELTAWSLYHANILGIMHHPGNKKDHTELTDEQIDQYAANLADIAIHTWRIRCIQFNTEKNLYSAQGPSSAVSLAQEPQSTETSPPHKDKPTQTQPTGTSTNKTSARP